MHACIDLREKSLIIDKNSKKISYNIIGADKPNKQRNETKMKYVRTNCEYYFEEGHLYFIATEDKLFIYRATKRGIKYLSFYLVRVISKDKYNDFNCDNYHKIVSSLRDMYKEYKAEIETKDDFVEYVNISIEGSTWQLEATNETYDNDPYINRWLGGK